MGELGMPFMTRRAYFKLVIAVKKPQVGSVGAMARCALAFFHQRMLETHLFLSHGCPCVSVTIKTHLGLFTLHHGRYI
jgi:hypothetical protein